MDTVACLVYGTWGIGKTWLAVSAPGPRLLIDVEGGAYHTEYPIIDVGSIKELAKDYKDYTDPDTTYIVDIEDDFWQAKAVIDWLRSGERHPFRSVLVDSFSELQVIAQQQLQTVDASVNFDPNEGLNWDGWRRVLNHFILMCQDLRRISRPTWITPVNVVITCGEDTERTPTTVLVDGQIRRRLLSYWDIVLYMHTAKNSKGADVRVAGFSPTRQYLAKCRIHRVSQHWEKGRIPNPTITELLEVIGNG